ncbi:MAG TPA: hypothetical protein EYP89_04470 [Candidatus Omnitrophica bacterium]|nr:hypothetical protein [Candidatus Omnitrophota bacterium]
MRKVDNFFKISFIFTFFLMIFIFSSNIEKRKERALYWKRKKEKIVLEKFNIEKIKDLIRKEKLSNKEALFYRRIGE